MESEEMEETEEVEEEATDYSRVTPEETATREIATISSRISRGHGTNSQGWREARHLCMRLNSAIQGLLCMYGCT